MEGKPIAQMGNGQPFVPPLDPFLNSHPDSSVHGEAINPIAAEVATIWMTITSVEIATIFSTSILFSISTSIITQTSFINIAAPSQIPDFPKSGLYPAPNTPSASISSLNNMNTSLAFPTSVESVSLSSSSATLSSLPFSNNSTSMLTTSTSLPYSATLVPTTRHESIMRLTIGLVAGIFVAASLLTGVVVFMRKRSQRSSETEAENAQRQQQPLINEPIPYSSAYGSNGQN